MKTAESISFPTRGSGTAKISGDNADSDGRPVIQEIINKAVVLQPGEMTTVRYRWRNLDETEPRWKIARLVYFAPWDWVIGTSVYEDELQTYHALLTNGRARMTRIMGGGRRDHCLDYRCDRFF